MVRLTEGVRFTEGLLELLVSVLEELLLLSSFVDIDDKAFRNEPRLLNDI